MTKSTISSYVKQVLARVTGNKEEVIAIRNERMAKASIDSMLSHIEAQIISAENTLGEAKDNYNNVLFSTNAKGELVPITSMENWANSLLDAKGRVIEAENKLESLEEAKAEFTTIKKEHFSE